MTSGALRHEHYSACGREQPLLACGPHDAPQVLIIPPLFGEMNRTRRLLADVMRALAADGLGTRLPNLPGTGESVTPLENTEWRHWQEAIVAAAAGAAASGPLIVASMRGGALLDGVAGALGWWRMVPATGKSLLRDLLRVRQLADAEEGRKPELAALQAQMDSETLELAGYRICPALARGLADAELPPRTPLRRVSLGNAADADAAVLAGPPLWRRAEPGSSRDLARAIAADITSWTRTCGAL